jgi:hypothetical protein
MVAAGPAEAAFVAAVIFAAELTKPGRQKAPPGYLVGLFD